MNYMKKISRLLPIALSALPMVAFAAASTLKELIESAIDLINPLLALLTGLAVLAFVWGIVKYIASAGDAKAKEGGKDIIIYGIIGLFVLFSFWGIVRFVKIEIFGN